MDRAGPSGQAGIYTSPAQPCGRSPTYDKQPHTIIMYPFYYPSSSYAPSSYTSSYPSYPSSSSDAEYLRALAEERAAREQYAAARRAQEEARQRAARARAARRAYAAPYSSYHEDDYNDLDLDMDLDDGTYYHPQRTAGYATGQPYGYASSPQFATSPQFSSSPYGLNPRQQRALLEEQRRRELLEEQRRRELLELERERRRQEEDRLRRILQEERQREEAERRRMLEEERARRALEEEKLRRAIEEEKLRRAMLEEEAARRERERTPLRSQQASLEPLLRALGFVPIGSDSDSDRERPSREARNGRGLRAHTTSPGPRRASAAPRSPIRQTKSSQPSNPSTTADSLRPKAPSPAPATTIPITSPRPSPKPSPKPAPAKAEEKKQDAPKPNLPSLDNPTPEQVSAAEKIQDAFRTYSARKHALKAISTLRKRFLTAKSNFTLPTTLDYEIASPNATSTPDGRAHTTVSVDPSAALPSPSLSAADEHADPFEHVPKLAYTPTNAPLHAYEEELNRILSALDAVESRGDAGVRAARRELARMVEREAERVERWRGVVWNWWTDREKAQKAQPAGVESDVPPVSLDQPEPEAQQPAESESMPVEQAEGTTQEQEQAMQVEPVDAANVAESAPAEEATPKAAPMEVEPTSESNVAAESAPVDTPVPEAQQPSVEPEQAPTPEIDIPDADVDEPAPPVEIEVEPPSRAEPAALDDEDVPDVPMNPSEPVSQAPSGAPIVEEEPAQLPSESTPTSFSVTISSPEPAADRAPTPPLSHDGSSESSRGSDAGEETEMEVEPQEVHTPPPGEHAPLVVVSPSEGEPHAEHPQQHQQQQSAAAEAGVAVPVSVPKAKGGGASPLVDRSWDEFRTYDMF
ncbi:hypothetical protein C8Q77DRAFT_1120700 [Trametes polyzona]|nr:hypothetical protein C8Q77DRAFT_1120700 [Trametes polyzona]